ncbi:MAG: leucine-rich repeat domain-containing protein [Clostridia bacterium]|nr:leucine-rich repeat domain-containing protein [Clostridia bacterium]
MGFEIKSGILIEYEPEPGVTEVEIPEGVTEIKEFAFAEDCEKIKSIAIPESVTRIGIFAFAGCKGLKSIRLPRNVRKVEKNAFAACYGLKEILVDERNSRYASVDGVLLTKDMKEIVIFPCGKPGHYVAPESVSRIRSRAFSRCRRLLSVTLPGRIKSIDFEAFDRCKELEFVDIPNGVEKIEGYVFSDCKKLRRVTGITEDTELSMTVFDRCPGMADADGFIIRNGVLYEYFGESETVTIPEDAKEIGRYAFQQHAEIKKIAIPESVQKIGSGAFCGCCGLADADGFVVVKGVLYSYHGKGGAISVPRTVTEIDDMVFCECDDVESIVIPETVKKIGSGAFAGCGDSCLKEVTFLADDLEFDEFKNAFYGDECVRIRGREGSTAQQYALECGIPFEIME